MEETVPPLSQEQMHAHFIYQWGREDCRAARSEVEECFFLEKYSLEPGGFEGWRMDCDQSTTELIDELAKIQKQQYEAWVRVNPSLAAELLAEITQEQTTIRQEP